MKWLCFTKDHTCFGKFMPSDGDVVVTTALNLQGDVPLFFMATSQIQGQHRLGVYCAETGKQFEELAQSIPRRGLAELQKAAEEIGEKLDRRFGPDGWAMAMFDEMGPGAIARLPEFGVHYAGRD